VAVASIAIALTGGLDLLGSLSSLTVVGKLVLVAVCGNLIGAAVFLLYRQTALWMTLLIVVEIAIVVSSVWLLSLDFIVVSLITLLCAMALIAVGFRPSVQHTE
jgi:hypothetical protein